MGAFRFNGVDELSISLEQLSHLDDDTVWSILSAGAEVVKTAHTKKLGELFTPRSGVLFESIKISRKKGKDGVVASVAPSGKHPGSSTGKRKKKGRSSGSYAGTNAEIAYILEYGSPRINARHWMETANEECADELTEAESTAWNEHLASLNL